MQHRIAPAAGKIALKKQLEAKLKELHAQREEFRENR